MDLKDFLDGVPHYQEFLTVDELNRSAKELAEKHRHVRRIQVGSSTGGEPICALRIGDGPRNALLFGFPHPNEPIGAMTLEYLSTRLAEDEALCRELGYTWFIIKCIDPDGARLNEGWFKGAFSPLKYALNYYRPPGKNQVEWTFPIDYKTLHFHSSLTETKTLMSLIETQKPDFMYSLHNAGFCGVYFYLGAEIPSVYTRLHGLVLEEGLPLHMGEPETPYIQKLDQAIFKMFGIEENYDFIERNSQVDPATILEQGTSSHGYLRSVCNGFTLVCEMPYYYDRRVGDDSPSDLDRREAVLRSIGFSEEVYKFLKPRFRTIAEKADPSHRLFVSVSDYVENFEKRLEPRKRHAETSADYEGKATVAQVFDNMVARKFGAMLTMGMTLRVADHVLKTRPNSEVEQARDEIYEKILETDKELGKEAKIELIPIRKLVRTQLGSGIIIAEYLRSRY